MAISEGREEAEDWQVTILLVARDHEPFVGDCLSSISREFGINVPLICIDVGSVDETLRRIASECAKLGLRPTTLAIDRSCTSIDALAAAQPNVMTPYVSAISGDDAYGPGYGRAVHVALQGNLGPTVFCFDLELTDASLQPLGERRSPRWSGNSITDRKNLLRGNPGTGPGVLLPWSLLVQQPGWQDRPKILVEDYWLWWTLWRCATFQRSAIGTVLYRQHTAALSRQVTSPAYAYSLGYCAGLARAHAETLMERTSSRLLTIRWARNVAARKLKHLRDGYVRAQLDYTALFASGR